ncbi:MAG: DNA-methyltransferase [Candidatus Bathyarchaeia archaeon]|jgi:DNA modification methylase
MVTKALKKKEVELGFIQIPTKARAEFFQDMKAPFETKLNNYPAKIDNQWRLKCSEFLKNKFPVYSEIELLKTDDGFLVKLNGEHEEAEVKKQNSPAPQLDLQNQVQTNATVLQGDCIKYLNEGKIGNLHLTFFDPPYLQGKEYRYFDDSQSETQYWNWVKEIIESVYRATVDGGAIYFMHREKNAEKILQIMREASWNYQNLIIWKKKTSAVPIETRFSKQYQIIVYSIKGKRPRVFNKIRIDPPPLPEHKYRHENGVYLTDVWDDIRELTSGYFAGDEAIRDSKGNRMHVQQTPVALLLRIILSSTMPGDTVFDPTAGSGTTLVTAKQLDRNSIGIEIDPAHVELIKKRISTIRQADKISHLREYHQFTPNLSEIWTKVERSNGQSKLTD